MVVLRGNNLEIKLGLVFGSNLHSHHLQMTNVTLVQRRGNIPTQINSKILKPLFNDFWEALQIEGMVPQLRTFHMDLHP